MLRHALFIAALLVSIGATGQKAKYDLFSIDSMKLLNATAKEVKYQGKQAIELVPAAGLENADQGMLAILDGPDFKDGTIEVELSGAPRPGSDPNSRGFIGIAFRVQGQVDKFECFYLRPSNGRADDQLQRNHTLQYISQPGYGWKKLRAEHPGMYESYADLVPGQWTKVKIVVAGTKAQLYVNGESQPSLIVTDLKQGDSSGKIALWSHTSTEGYFSNLTVR